MLCLKLQLEVKVTMLERVELTILLLFHLTAITPTPLGAAGTVLNSYQGDDETHDYQATVPVPGNTTVLFMMTASWKYRTTYQFFDTCLLRSLHTTFSNANIVCDLRMLETLFMGRQPAAITNAAYPYELYTTCATLMGDR